MLWPKEGDVVIGRKQGNQPEDKAADGLGEAKAIEAEDPASEESGLAGTSTAGRRLGIP
jgi:hypothetical protein